MHCHLLLGVHVHLQILSSLPQLAEAVFAWLTGVCLELQVTTWSRHSAKINLLLLFGEHILSVDVESNLFVWAFRGIDENLAPVGHIMLGVDFTPSCIMHPDTYLNKVLLSGVIDLKKNEILK